MNPGVTADHSASPSDFERLCGVDRPAGCQPTRLCCVGRPAMAEKAIEPARSRSALKPRLASGQADPAPGRIAIRRAGELCNCC